ncbi:Aspartate-semialdehyde dehydrogenase [Serratia odorifera]|uniref:Aspartate-semialdehyde dehydrogenase n=1 Tax=Serratia odorifera TaxID=618 RepID=A0A3S4DF18_SEROD|nr:Aspartate-semialdehyde dehydrogenase [Serratia odorifera]
MKNVGLVGWRGMVGSVLMQRMAEERDFDAIRRYSFLHLSTVPPRQPSAASRTARCKMLTISMR